MYAMGKRNRGHLRGNIKDFLFLGLLLSLAIGTSSYLWLGNPQYVAKTLPEKALAPQAIKTKGVATTVYPTLYSDTHITENAIDTDPRFKNSVVWSGESQVASILNSVSVQTCAKTCQPVTSAS